VKSWRFSCFIRLSREKEQCYENTIHTPMANLVLQIITPAAGAYTQRDDARKRP
jgi:hypothetical protein